jgi:hypothetical protein
VPMFHKHPRAMQPPSRNVSIIRDEALSKCLSILYLLGPSSNAQTEVVPHNKPHSQHRHIHHIQPQFPPALLRVSVDELCGWDSKRHTCRHLSQQGQPWHKNMIDYSNSGKILRTWRLQIARAVLGCWMPMKFQEARLHSLRWK